MELIKEPLYISNETQFGRVKLIDNNIIGSCGFKFEGEVVEIAPIECMLQVDQYMRGNGHGEQLFGAALEYAMEQARNHSLSLKMARFQTGKFNYGMQRIGELAGFKLVGEDVILNDVQYELVYAKDLSV